MTSWFALERASEFTGISDSVLKLLQVDGGDLCLLMAWELIPAREPSGYPARSLVETRILLVR